MQKGKNLKLCICGVYPPLLIMIQATPNLHLDNSDEPTNRSVTFAKT